MNMKMKFLGCILSISFFMAGCQAMGTLKPSEGGSFMSLWNTYALCQGESDLQQLSQHALMLKNAAGHTVPQDSFVIPLPGQIQRLVTTPSSRFAVDVKAMAASCSIRAAQVAMQRGRDDVARSLLESVLEYHHSDYAYYSTQAKSMLSELDNPAVRVSLRVR
jgi:hypothetical protein